MCMDIRREVWHIIQTELREVLLQKKQTASMFETGTLYTDDTEVIFRAKDIEEMNGHFKMFNYIMKNIEAPLDEDLIKGMHRNLKEGVFEDFANGYAIGDWKKRENRVSDINVALPQEVPEKIHNPHRRIQ